MRSKEFRSKVKGFGYGELGILFVRPSLSFVLNVRAEVSPQSWDLAGLHRQTWNTLKCSVENSKGPSPRSAFCDRWIGDADASAGMPFQSNAFTRS